MPHFETNNSKNYDCSPIHIFRVNEPSTSNVNCPDENERTSEILLPHDNNTDLMTTAIIRVKGAL